MLCPARRINEKECSGCAEELKFRDWPNHTKKRKTGTCRASPLNSSSATLLGCQRPQNVGHVVTGFRHRWPNKVLSSSLSYWPAITLTICMLARKKRERGKGMWMVSAALEWLRSFASRRDHSHSYTHMVSPQRLGPDLSFFFLSVSAGPIFVHYVCDTMCVYA